MEFSGKVVLVTGAGSGKAIAEAFSREKARVVLNDVDAPAAGVVEQLDVRFFQADLTLFLVSDRARSMTGASYLKDLGWTAR